MGDVLFMEIWMACYDCIPLTVPNILFTPFTQHAKFAIFNNTPLPGKKQHTHIHTQHLRNHLGIEKYEALLQLIHLHVHSSSY